MRYLLIIILVITSTSALAVNNNKTLKVAADFLKNKDYQKAYELLQSGYEKTNATADELFLLGMAAKQIGKFMEASNYLEHLLKLKPKAHRAKLELAQIARILGDDDKAKRYLLNVKSSNPPHLVAENIDRFLKAIETGEGAMKSWQLFASVGWQFDTNANAGPNSETVSFFGLPFSLSDDAKPIEDQALAVSVGGYHFARITDSFKWKSNLSVNWTAHEKLESLDSLVVSASTGASWQQTHKLSWNLSFIGDFVRVGYKNDFYSASFGLAPQMRYAITKQLSFNFNSTFSQRKYNHQRKRDAGRWTIAPSLGYSFNNNTFVKAGYLMGQEEAELSFFTQDFWGFNGMLFHNFGYGINLSANATFIDTRYKGKEAAHNKRRHDRMLRTGVNLSYHLNFIDSAISASYNYTDNESNLEIYQYDRHQLFLTLRKSI